jgi:hypothetical protein
MCLSRIKLRITNKSEVDVGLEMFKNRKAAGEDKIVSDCLKKGEPKLKNQLHNL